jgi:FkbM family methyltransferase
MSRHHGRIAAFLLCVLLLPPAVAAQQAGVHPLSGRRIAPVMSVEGADWLDRPERAAEENPDRAISVLRVAKGSTVADIGAGSGYMTVKLARKVGPEGRVYAVDIQPGMLELVKKRIDKARLDNVTVVLGAVDDPRLPEQALDLALMVDVYHELSQPQVMLRRLRDAIKPDGRLVLVEYRGEDPDVPIRPEHKMTVAVARLEVEAEGYTLTQTSEVLPQQHILIFTRH